MKSPHPIGMAGQSSGTGQSIEQTAASARFVPPLHERVGPHGAVERARIIPKGPLPGGAAAGEAVTMAGSLTRKGDVLMNAPVCRTA